MEKPFLFCAGRVCFVGSATTKTGKAYAVISVELSAREWNGKTYRNRIEVRDFQMKTEWRVGDFVTAAGEGAAEVEQGRDGRSWGKLVLVGRVQKMETPEATTQTNEEGATPEPA